MEIDPFLMQALMHGESQDYAGYDPYDALNSPLLCAMTKKSKWGRLAVTQALRRSPINVRPLLGICKGHNPKGVGLFLWSYAKLFRVTGDVQFLSRVDYLLRLLNDLRCHGYSGNCWGYNFDWQSRTYYRPKGTPTIVNSAFIGHALLDCHEMTASRTALDMAMSIRHFLLNDLNRTRMGNTFCFSYTPIDHEIVHNANLLGASFLVRLTKYMENPSLIDPALASLAYSMNHQRDDGSWYYADTVTQKWIDSFHTGFNLQAIRYVLHEGYGTEYRNAYERGVTYYTQKFFLEDGAPKYFHDRLYPIDIHAPAQALVFLAGMGSEFRELTDRIRDWMLGNMTGLRGTFIYQRHKRWTNRIDYMRWAQAWACHALSEYVLQCQSKSAAVCLDTVSGSRTAA